MARTSIGVLSVVCCLGNFDVGQPGDAVSLIQVHKRYENKHASSPKHHEGRTGRWMGGFFQCTQVNPGTKSGCSVLQSSEDHPNVEQRSLRHLGSASSCASFTRLAGADTFNFEENRRCEPVTCHGITMKFSQDPSAASNVTVYSLYCGMEKIHGSVAPKACGWTEFGYHRFSHPPPKACDNELQFTGISQGAGDNLPLFRNVLPGTDLAISASAGHQAKMVGMMDGFGVIAIYGGDTTTLTFRFLQAGTQTPKMIDMFTFTIADLEVKESCVDGQMSVSAEHFAGYYLADTPHIDVEDFPGNETAPAWAKFRAIGDGQEDLDHGVLTTHQQKKSVSLYYRHRDTFKLTVGVSPNLGSRNIKFGGGLLMRCDGSH